MVKRRLLTDDRVKCRSTFLALRTLYLSTCGRIFPSSKGMRSQGLIPIPVYSPWNPASLLIVQKVY